MDPFKPNSRGLAPISACPSFYIKDFLEIAKRYFGEPQIGKHLVLAKDKKWDELRPLLKEAVAAGNLGMPTFFSIRRK